MDATTAGGTIRAERRIDEVIRAHPRTLEVFKQFGIDSCCGGTAGIGEAALRDGADPDALLAALNRSVGRAV